MSNKVAVIVGSLRKDSLNRKMAQALVVLAPQDLKLELVEINNLPIYDEDLEGEGITPPTEWSNFRKKMTNYDGVLFITPEYNRSIPGVLKNAIDVGSRPYGHSIWSGKPTAIMSLSPGAIGGFGANHHLRQCLVFLDMPAMQQPEAYIGQAATLFNEQNELIKEETKTFCKKFLERYQSWLTANTAVMTNLK